ncbi:MAG: ribosome-associated translation inhibitor RaiA [Spirochaetes bacterium]|nr:ribosome-associated translation inhibitor RaiA [Spirochaetota bacterium]
MQVTIQGSKNFHVSDRMKEYINKKLVKLNYFKNTINDINFHLDAEKHIFKISSILTFKKFGPTKIETSAEEMYTAIDKIIHKLDTKIQREKSRIQDHNNPGHMEIVEKLDNHEIAQAEPTRFIELEQKPTTLSDAVLQMKMKNIDYYGFTLLDEDEKFAPALLRKLDDEMIFLFKKEKNNNYSEYILKILKDNIKLDKKIREIELKKMTLLEAQRFILKDEFYYNIFLDNDNKINFLLKESNNKWDLIS